MKRLSLVLCLVLLGSCATTTNDGSVLTRPYTAEQIRESNSPGTSLVFRIEQAGAPVVHQVFEFGATDGETVELGGRTTDMDGNPIGQSQVTKPSWVELRDHATYSPSNASRSEATATVPSGTYDCTLFTVRMDGGGIDRYYFANDRPGPPVLCTKSSASGEEVFRMELISVTKR